MTTLTTAPNPRAAADTRSDTLLLIGIAAAVALLHILTNNRYGFHRDELQVLSDALHMDWGFVPYPPFTPFIERVGMALFGHSIVGLRMFSVLAQAIIIVVSGLMARELGGGRLAQIAAALAVATSGLPIFEATEFQYTSYDNLWWVLIAYFVIRLLKSEDPRWWLPIGVAAGVGLQTKYTMCFFLAGVFGGLLLTPARRYLASRWLWMGVALAFLIFLPNLLWQVRHDFISLKFLHYIHTRDVNQGRGGDFFVNQFWLCTNIFSVPLWIAGLVAYFRSPRYRMIAWMYVIPLVIFAVSKARFYYLCAAYPMLIAMGAVVGAAWLASLSRAPRRVVQAVFFTGLLLAGAVLAAVLVPFATSGPLKQFALSKNGDLREEIGWTELVAATAGVRDSLPAEQQKTYGVVVGNYGEQGAVEILGPAYHLPPPISNTNSGWLRGYPTPQPSPLIVLGLSQSYADSLFTGCRLAGHNGNSEGVKNEESEDHPDIFVCDAPRLPWPDFWREFQNYG
jgi:4-amino-4-deoxy-L-arabinose transferase-like glycosyltransferase